MNRECRPDPGPRPDEVDQRADYLYRINRCGPDHYWPPELTPSAICGGCGLEYGDFSEERVA